MAVTCGSIRDALLSVAEVDLFLVVSCCVSFSDVSLHC